MTVLSRAAPWLGVQCYRQISLAKSANRLGESQGPPGVFGPCSGGRRVGERLFALANQRSQEERTLIGVAARLYI